MTRFSHYYEKEPPPISECSPVTLVNDLVNLSKLSYARAVNGHSRDEYDTQRFQDLMLTIGFGLMELEDKRKNWIPKILFAED